MNVNSMVHFQNYSIQFLKSLTSKVPAGLKQNILNIGLAKPEQLKDSSNLVQSTACDSTKAGKKQECKTNTGIHDMFSRCSQINLCSSGTA